MKHVYILWIVVAAYGFHILEEFTFDWKDWAIAVLNLPVTWTQFAVANGLVIVLGISCASVGWNLAAYALSLPALMLINATFFHVLPFIVTQGRFSPGLATALLLFYPVGLWAYYGAWKDEILSLRSLLMSLVLGAVFMAFPIIMLKLRVLPYFQQ